MGKKKSSRAAPPILGEFIFDLKLGLACVIIAFALIPTARSQSNRNITAAPKRPAAQEPIQTRAGEVSAPVVVYDRRTRKVILDLTESDFHVFDNGVEQKINHFDIGGEPLSIALLVETSSRVEPMLSAIQRAGIVFTSTVMGRTGETAVLGYDDDVTVIEPFTPDSDRVRTAINHLSLGTSGLRLYDAMVRGISLLKECALPRRRILMVIGEARDSGSGAELASVIKMAEVTNVTVYSVKLSSTAVDFRQPVAQYEPPQVGPEGTYAEPQIKMRPPSPENARASQPNMNLGALTSWVVGAGKNAVASNPLELASAATGGLTVNVADDRAIQNAVDGIGGELHAVYAVGYRTPEGQPSGYHSIKVTVNRKGVKVRTRPGYYLAPPEQ
ncbi:MAG TPA: VWA domain-containing protein [Candidatus Sulfotelmatobacter sp.]|nr:VWA domain-containing protein [Candidatus Sulfotelmatobacter sp.]